MNSEVSQRRTLAQRFTAFNKTYNDLPLEYNLVSPTISSSLARQTNKETENLSSTATVSIPIPATYALFPQRKYDFFRAQKVLQQELRQICDIIPRSKLYDPVISIDFILDLAQKLRRVLRTDQSYSSRYKIVVYVNLAQLCPSAITHQHLSIASRCLWNPETDGSITASSSIGKDTMVSVVAFFTYTD